MFKKIKSFYTALQFSLELARLFPAPVGAALHAGPVHAGRHALQSGGAGRPGRRAYRTDGDADLDRVARADRYTGVERAELEKLRARLGGNS